jgi:glycosyltransferase involved in cell wall biosynthesis
VFIDNLPQQQLSMQYRKTHCVIIPSKCVETGPMVFHEAAACGCDIISSDIGGQGELVNVYRDKAFSFNFGNSESLYKVIVGYKPSGKGKHYEPMSWNEHFQHLAERIKIA